MKQIFHAIGVLSALAVSGFAHEYPLQFTPASGARGLVVAGYQITASTVTGTCSYYTVTSGSGRGGGYHTTTNALRSNVYLGSHRQPDKRHTRRAGCPISALRQWHSN